MKVLIRHAGVPVYWATRGAWTPDPREAMAFLDEVRAQDYAFYHEIDQAVPVRARRGRAARPAGLNQISASIQLDSTDCMRTTELLKNEGTVKRARKATSSLAKPAAKRPRRTVINPAGDLAPISKPAVASAVMEEMPTTLVLANINVGLGNTLFIRGQGGGLSWDQGVALECLGPSTWVWSTPTANEPVIFKLLLNDLIWADGENLTVRSGERIEVRPDFARGEVQ